MFRKLSQLRWLVLMTGIVLGMAIVGCTGAISGQPSVQPGRFTDSKPVAMTCTAETYRSSGFPGRYYCNMAKGPDGKEVPVGLPGIGLADTRVGHKMSNCTEKEGKITCPTERLAVYERSTPWFQLNPSTFPPVEIPESRKWWRTP